MNRKHQLLFHNSANFGVKFKVINKKKNPFDASNNFGLEITANNTQYAFTNSHPISRQHKKYT